MLTSRTTAHEESPLYSIQNYYRFLVNTNEVADLKN